MSEESKTVNDTFTINAHSADRTMEKVDVSLTVDVRFIHISEWWYNYNCILKKEIAKVRYHDEIIQLLNAEFFIKYNHKHCAEYVHIS